MAAAILTAHRAGLVWATPFSLVGVFGQIDIRELPPKQVLALASRQARVSLDKELVGESVHRPDSRYLSGIDWAVIRTTLADLKRVKAFDAKRALVAWVRQSFWFEDRLHAAGLEPSPHLPPLRAS